jgi:twitching motility two-component system response regulator PilG/twitching motility two-component system response regulator PilH
MARRRRVLIVDDSSAQLGALAAAFEDAGYEVGEAHDGEEVLRKLSALDPDALLLDVYMPKLHGAEVCRLVKAHPHWKKTWLVLMSSRIGDREIEDFRKLGANEILRKPFDPAVAVAAVAKGIGPGEPSAP